MTDVLILLLYAFLVIGVCLKILWRQIRPKGAKRQKQLTIDHKLITTNQKMKDIGVTR